MMMIKSSSELGKILKKNENFFLKQIFKDVDKFSSSFFCLRKLNF